MAFQDSLREIAQTQFGGLHHSAGAGDGEIFDMQNLTSDYAPLLATRQKRRLSTKISQPYALFAWDKLCYVSGTGFYFNGAVKGTVTEGPKAIAAMGQYIVIMPDKMYYDILSDTFGSLESSVTVSATFADGTYAGETAEGNTIKATPPLFDWSGYFRVGDAVSISGAVDPENNVTIIVREIDGDELRFYENSFTKNPTSASITVSRTVPDDLIFLCENENRLWASEGKRIYASKLGDPFNWNVFDGLDTDSWSWPADDAGIIGGITACVSYQGYPVFFQEDNILKVYGSKPKNFQTMGGANIGVKKGASASLAIAGETLYYLSTAGFMAYGGGQPRPIGQAFGLERQSTAVGGSDGLKYYASAQVGGAWKLYVYDPQYGVWHIEDSTHAVGFARYEGNLWMLASDGKLWAIGTILGTPGTEEEDFAWYAEFADWTDLTSRASYTEAHKKGVTSLSIRLELDARASCEVYVKYDSTGDWIKAGKTMTAGAKRSYILPIIPRRADHYRLKIAGTGGCRVYSILRRLYIGSELKSLPGVN